MNARACILALLASACGPSTCGGGVATPPAPPPRGPTDAPAEWPETDHALPNAMPATSIAVTRDAITVSNEGLIASWPSADRARAAGDPPEGEPRWPIVTRRIERPGAEGALLPALGEALALTRRAERAATGLGSGASQCNLRIAIDVPFEHVQRVLYTLGVAGYASPRVLYGAGGSDRALALVPSPARGATPEEVAAALARIAPGAPSAPSPAAAPARPTARLEVRAGSLIVIDGERALAPGCEREADPDAPTFVEEPRPEAVARCVERLGDRAIILAIEGGVPFGRVAALAASLAPRPISLTLLR